MIKMSTVNFSEKTVENIEVSCDDMKEIKFEFLDNTLRLSIVKENDKEVIEEIIKEEMEDDEVVKEEPTEDVIEEKVIEKLTIDDLKKIIYETIPKKNTAETYFRTIKQVHDNFDEDDVNELLKKENEIIEFIETKYDKLSTIKNKLCGMLKVYNLLNLESNVLKSKIDHYMVSLSIQEDKKKEDPTDKKTIQEAELIVNYFKNELGMMEDMISKDVDILNTWDKTAQLYAVLKIYLTYGMLRPSEIMDMKITDTDEGNEQKNYINVVTKKMIIHNHKNDRKGTKVIDITDDTLNDILSRGLNNYLITNHSGEVYTSSSSFSKMFKSRFNDYNPYDLRKCISSLAIHEGDTEKINMLEHNQGHCLNTILKNYNTYNKVDVQ
jgi:integrase